VFLPGPADFGYGWIIANVWPRTCLHLGQIAGFESAIFVLPDLGVTSVVLSNVEGTETDAIAAKNAVTGAYAEYEGECALSDRKATLRVFIKGKTLTAQVSRRAALPLDYVSGDVFVSLRDTPSELHVSFERDASGQMMG
jgi:hypothetical protein